MFGNRNIRGRRNRSVELAAMIKEVGNGTIEKLNEIIAKFALKTGVSKEVADSYLDLFKQSTLVIIRNGEESWLYNQEVESEIFGVTI